MSDPPDGPGLVSPQPRDPPPAGAPASLLCVALAALVCAVSASWLEPLRRPEPGDPLAAKLAALEARGASVDTLFVGSSMVYRHVDPARFDAATAAAGRPTHSFNLGAPGMGGLELAAVLARVSALDLPSLRRVVIDWRGSGIFLAEENRLTPRVLAWHDGPSTLAAMQMVVERAERELGPEAGRAAVWRAAWPWFDDHLVAWAHRRVALGSLGGRLEAWFGGTASEREARASRDAQEARRVLGPAGDGFLDLEADLATGPPELRADLERRRQALGEGRAAYLAQLASARARRSLGGPEPAPAEGAVLAGLMSGLRARGLAVYGLEFPNLPPTRRLAGANGAGLDLPLLDLSDARRLPQLFAYERRFDRNHLDAQGAAALTDELAALWLQAAPEVER